MNRETTRNTGGGLRPAPRLNPPGPIHPEAARVILGLRPGDARIKRAAEMLNRKGA